MKIKLLVSVASVNGVHGKGSVVDFPDEEAIRYIKSGQAVKDGESETETAVPKHTKKEKAIK